MTKYFIQSLNPNSASSASHKAKIYAHLMDGHTINPYASWVKFSCYRLASRISDLKREGKKVSSRWLVSAEGKRVKEYYMSAEDRTYNESLN